MRFAKIIATLGPACEDIEIMRQMVQQGVDVFRLNLSHGSHAVHAKSIALIKKIQAENNHVKPAILVDLQGPKIRIGSFKNGEVFLIEGKQFDLSLDHDINSGTDTVVGIDESLIVSDVKIGQKLLLDDGNIMLKAIHKTDRVLSTEVLVGGTLSGKKGINLKGGGLSTTAFTPKDQKDLIFALQHDIDFVALSFVEKDEDIIHLKSFIQSQQSGCSPSIIAKIERAEAIKRINEIAEVSDGLMIARGDLALEVGLAKVPHLQKSIIQVAKKYDCFSIVATQMMESMIHSFTPTRAEVSDVANANIDEADALMLSAETSVGKYPVQVIKQMAEICKQDMLMQGEHEIFKHNIKECDTTRVLTLNGCQIAADLLAKALVVYTEKGRTALFASRQKIHIPIYALSQNKMTCLKMNLLRGVSPVLVSFLNHDVASLDVLAVRTLVDQNNIQSPDTVVILKGDLVGVSGHTNSIEVWTASDLLKFHDLSGQTKEDHS